MYKKFLVILLFHCCFIFSSLANSEQRTIKIASGPIISRYYLVASKLCYFIKESNSKVNCEVIPTNGSLENLELLRERKVDLGISQSDIAVEAFNGIEYYSNQKPFLELRQLLNLFTESFNVIAKDDDRIKMFSDLNGKKISYGTKKSATYLTYEELKEFYPDLKPVEIEINPDEYAKKLCNGQIDALLIMAGHPSPIINLLANTCNLEFVTIENDKLHQLLEHNRAFKKHKLNKEIYSGISHDQHTVGVTAILLTYQNQNIDILSNLINYFKSHIKEFHHTDELLKTFADDFFITNFVLPQHECLAVN